VNDEATTAGDLPGVEEPEAAVARNLEDCPWRIGDVTPMGGRAKSLDRGRANIMATTDVEEGGEAEQEGKTTCGVHANDSNWRGMVTRLCGGTKCGTKFRA